jgi:glyoxylase-like metal-dependent hydrolase (beta-lactamase superfamily II)/8-oxo-dGTP pyrophosphatase MutT (NUDIX family)
VKEPPAVEPRPAATVVLLRPAEDGGRGLEVLLTQRPAAMTFAADLHVFPGGRLDPLDFEAPDPFRAAAVRELEEEAGVILDPADLVPLAHWVTPPYMPRRFDTRFFAAELPPGARPVFAPDEVVAHRWLPARAALDAMAAGEIAMWLPTSTTLQRLELVASFADVRERLAPDGWSWPAPRVVDVAPYVVLIETGGAGGVPGQTANAYVVGRDVLVVVDPGDPSESAADAILAAAAGAGAVIGAVALTEAAPEHAAGAESLAHRLRVPIVTGLGIGRDLPHEVRELADGERLTAGDLALTLVDTRASEPRHVAWVVDDGRGPSAICGDLAGPSATKAIAPPPDLPARRAAIARLRSLGVDRLYPGHGDRLDLAGSAELRRAAPRRGSG